MWLSWYGLLCTWHLRLFIEQLLCNSVYVLIPGKAVGSLFLSPAVTPWKSTLPGVGSNNPSIRLYEYNRVTGQVINYQQYFLNLSQVISTGRDQWEKEYDAVQDLQLGAASPSAFMSAAMSFRQNQLLFTKYLQYNSASQNMNPSCDDRCLKVHICTITELKLANFHLCLNSPYPTTSAWHSRPHPHHPHHSKPIPRYMVVIICTLAAMVFIAAVVIAIICIKRHSVSIPHRYNRFNSQLGGGPINWLLLSWLWHSVIFPVQWLCPMIPNGCSMNFKCAGQNLFINFTALPFTVPLGYFGGLFLSKNIYVK